MYVITIIIIISCSHSWVNEFVQTPKNNDNNTQEWSSVVGSLFYVKQTSPFYWFWILELWWFWFWNSRRPDNSDMRHFFPNFNFNKSTSQVLNSNFGILDSIDNHLGLAVDTIEGNESRGCMLKRSLKIPYCQGAITRKVGMLKHFLMKKEP